jgi:hypothetical protein
MNVSISIVASPSFLRQKEFIKAAERRQKEERKVSRKQAESKLKRQ